MTDHQTFRWSFVGLGIAFLGLPAAALAFRLAVGNNASFWPPLLAREVMIFLLLGALLFVVRHKEGQPWSSIGLLRQHAGQTLLWSLVAFFLLAAGTALALVLLKFLGLHYGGSHGVAPPLWITALVVVRAGIVEEIFYRGYAIERLQTLSRSRAAAGALSVTAFALSHYHQGIAGILVAAILGAILTLFYIWRRNLAANMGGHLMIDLIPNVLLPILGI